MNIPLRCRCGSMTGVIQDATPENGNHVVCYCDDCQAFARFIGPEGVMNEKGGTEIYQTTPSQIQLLTGKEHLRLLRLSPSGLMRWYAGCCRTPIGNCLRSPKSPFVGVFPVFFDLKGAAIDDWVGPVVAQIQGRYAIGGCPPDVHPRASFSILYRSIVFLARAAWSNKHQPSPFYEAGTGKPVVEAQVLSPEERDRLDAPS